MEQNDSEKLDFIIGRMAKIKSVQAIILFGSQTRGKPRKDSDIDLAVIMKGNTRENELAAISLGNEKFDISIFNKLPLVLQFRVLKEGKVLFLRDKKIIYDKKVETFRRYLDFSHFINNFYRRVIKNV